MWTLGIDVAKKKHYATLLDHQGELVFTNRAFTLKIVTMRLREPWIFMLS